MNEKQMQHGKDWQGQDLTGWLLSEKFDGCRAFWDGSRMWSRQGFEIQIPDAWRSTLPSFALDGEIFHPAGLVFASNAVRLGGRHFDGCSFIAFDAPDVRGYWLARLDVARSFGVRAVEVTIAESTDHAISLMLQIQARGGEGLVARHPGLEYKPGRTARLLKLKTVTPKPVPVRQVPVENLARMKAGNWKVACAMLAAI